MKTASVVFGKEDVATKVTYTGQAIEQKNEYTYLGIIFDCKLGPLKALKGGASMSGSKVCTFCHATPLQGGRDHIAPHYVQNV
jgi:hypothetical protein